MYKDTKQRQKIRYLDDNLTLDVELWRERLLSLTK